MSLFADMTSAALLAQDTLTEITGEGSFTITGDSTTYTGVFNEINESDPLTPTGIKTIRMLTIMATKDQFNAAPSAAPRVTITAKGSKWVLQSTTDMPLHYRLTCRPLT